MNSIHPPLLIILSVLGTSQALQLPFIRRSYERKARVANSVIVQRYEAIRNVLANAPQDFHDLYFLDPWTVKFTGPGKPKHPKPRIIVNNAPLRNLPSYLQEQKDPKGEKEGRRFQPLVVVAAIAFFTTLAFRPAIARAHYSPYFLDPATLTYVRDQAKTSKIIAGFQGSGSIVGLFASALLVGVALALSTLDGIDYWTRLWSKIRETKGGEMSSDEATSRGAAKRSSWAEYMQKLKPARPHSSGGLNKGESQENRKATQFYKKKRRDLHEHETAPYLDSLKAYAAHEELKQDPQKTYLDSLSSSDGSTWNDYAVKLNENMRRTENAPHIEQSIHHASAATSPTKSTDTELQEHEAMSDEFEESMREAAELKSNELSRTETGSETI
ncbi:hypothetical protein THAOC_03068 [Thalassiosira oceanica]|uniref:Uncharacterized protein n=1 Tax=Thalassiosira oceanica TaxID=159749 RepID=K0TDP3_THAOC|nr:hypothetical protein THAOC_03068 [Thalassiosira oceanica]|eukprot:EJK75214.1 hypothetical protein THAOC_03068 [Thalassiosira oceanica]